MKILLSLVGMLATVAGLAAIVSRETPESVEKPIAEKTEESVMNEQLFTLRQGIAEPLLEGSELNDVSEPQNEPVASKTPSGAVLPETVQAESPVEPEPVSEEVVEEWLPTLSWPTSLPETSESEPTEYIIIYESPEPMPKPKPPAEPITEATPEPAPEPEVAPITFSIEIISPMPGKGVGREYEAAIEVTDEKHYVEIGAVLRDSNENVIDTAVMEIAATDETQNRTLRGTGNYNKHWGKYYPYHYEFHFSGTHVVEFKAKGVTQTVTFNVN